MSRHDGLPECTAYFASCSVRFQEDLRCSAVLVAKASEELIQPSDRNCFYHAGSESRVKLECAAPVNDHHPRLVGYGSSGAQTPIYIKLPAL